jgi:prevent-host-death family protein
VLERDKAGIVSDIRVSMTDLRQKLGDLVNRAAYGGDRIVLVSRGQPRAAIIGIDELRRLDQLSSRLATYDNRFDQALASADLLRERVRRWQEAHNIEPEDAVEDLRRIRERRDDELADLL